MILIWDLMHAQGLLKILLKNYRGMNREEFLANIIGTTIGIMIGLFILIKMGIICFCN